MPIEYRTVNGGSVGADGGLTGMVTPFGVETVIGDLKRGGFREEIAPGTFTKTLQERAAVLIHNHDTAMPMASTAVPEGQEGHLTLTQESDGFRASAPQPIETSYTSDVRKLAKAGILGMSFGFEVTKDDWFDDQGRASNSSVGTKRIIREVKLHEVSTTAFPAYGSTMGTVSARDTIAAARGVAETRDYHLAGDGDPFSPEARTWVHDASYGNSQLPIGDQVPAAQKVLREAEERADNKPYGNVEYADPKNGKYPVDTKEHAKAAWAYINMPKNAEEYPLNGVTLASVKDKIKAALAKFGVQVSEENAARLALEFRAEVAESDHAQGIASIDATLDEAKDIAAKLDRNSLPPEVNQIIDLINAAGTQIDALMDKAGIPDPDEPSNSNDYTEAGSTTSDEDERASDFALADRILADMCN